MAAIKTVTGLNTVLRNLTSAKKNLAAGIARGLKKGGLHLQRKSQEIVPVDWGDLKGSSFIRNIGGSGFDTDIVVGYGNAGANYAVFVHEDLNKAHGKAFNIKHAAEIAAGKMTYKGKKIDTLTKTREEIEFKIEDIEKMKDVFGLLGFPIVLSVKKERELFIFQYKNYKIETLIEFLLV